jgi:hypothetical protein
MPVEAGNVEDAQAGLYRVPLAEFVPACDQLAASFLPAGHQDGARPMAALRRRSGAAWAQLARPRRPGALQDHEEGEHEDGHQHHRG